MAFSLYSDTLKGKTINQENNKQIKILSSCSPTTINAVFVSNVKHEHTCSVSCVTCASSSFSPLAGVDGTGIFLADEGLDVGVEDLGVVALDLEAPTAVKRFITQGWMTDSVIVTQHLLSQENTQVSTCSELGSYKIIIT